MTIMLAGGACHVRYPCGHTAVFAANETIGPCSCEPPLPAALRMVK